jgi:AAA ATPase domain
MTATVHAETLIGRSLELRRLLGAVRKRESMLVWGPRDAGKTALLQTAIAELTAEERSGCIVWSGAASRKQLLSQFIGRLFDAGDPFVQAKVHADGADQGSLNRWAESKTSLRLRGILFTAAARGECRFVLDHFPPASHDTARLIQELMQRCKAPVYLTGPGCSVNDIGFAWSLYWNDALRIHVGPLNLDDARSLLEACIKRLGLNAFDLAGFREEVLRWSGRLPGAIVRMCELAADARYRYRDRIKTKLVHVDYLMQARASADDRGVPIVQ